MIATGRKGRNFCEKGEFRLASGGVRGNAATGGGRAESNDKLTHLGGKYTYNKY